MTQIIDRRLNGKNRNAVNRGRFIRRFKQQVRKAAADAVSGRSITDTSGEQVHIPSRDISEPRFSHALGGRREAIYSGNREFVTGDRFKRPPGGAGGGGAGPKAGSDGVAEDDFTFELSRDEFLECVFEDLELPDMVKTDLKETVTFERVRAGFSRDGVPANINIVRSLRGALARRIALRGSYTEHLREAQTELDELKTKGLGGGIRARELAEEIKRLESHIKAIPFIDDFDLRYNNHTLRPNPSTKAVMFCLMDVSGSMDESRKDIAKRFFILLHLFLTRSYERIDVVFICHHSVAREVSEEEFFYARETGGTVVSSALKLMLEIIENRYPVDDWNIYGAQASDGENWGDDSLGCRELLLNHLMPLSQYFAYIEITPASHQALWNEYESVAAACPGFAIQSIADVEDIYPVFRRFLVKRAP